MYCEFKDKNPDKKVGFSKFAELRPRHCVLAGASGTHSVCVCTIHQNIKLMMYNVRLSTLPTYHYCLARIMCNPPRYCKVQRGAYNENDMDQIIYKQWISTNRSTLETFCVSTDEFVDIFCEKLVLLRPYSFIASEQAAFYVRCKESLQPSYSGFF